MGFLIRNYKIIGALVLLAALYFAYATFSAHYQQLKSERDTYLLESETQKIATDVAEARAGAEASSHATTKTNFKTFKRDSAQSFIASQEKLETVMRQYEESQGTVQELRRKLSKHDTELLTRIKPGLMERIVNKGTAQTFRAIEKLTAREPEQ